VKLFLTGVLCFDLAHEFCDGTVHAKLLFFHPAVTGERCGINSAALLKNVDG